MKLAQGGGWVVCGLLPAVWCAAQRRGWAVGGMGRCSWVWSRADLEGDVSGRLSQAPRVAAGAGGCRGVAHRQRRAAGGSRPWTTGVWALAVVGTVGRRDGGTGSRKQRNSRAAGRTGPALPSGAGCAGRGEEGATGRLTHSRKRRAGRAATRTTAGARLDGRAGQAFAREGG